MELQNQHLKLRELLATDLPAMHELQSLPETDRYNTAGIPANLAVTETLLSELIAVQTELPRKKYTFVIETADSLFTGLIGINIGKPRYSNAEIWYKIHPDYWNKGYATSAVNTVLHFCFTTLDLHRVEAGCAVANTASVKVLEKAGMIKEGTSRKLLPIRGEWFDGHAYAILETDFYARNQAAV